MKLKLLSVIAAFATIAIVYTSCKKDAVDYGSKGTGTTSTVSSKDVTSQIALNLSQNLFGGLGGFDISDGLSPKINALAPNHKKIIINGVDPNGCGTLMDTTMTYSLDIDTTKLTISGRYKIGSICSAGKPTGLTMYDSLLVAMSTPSLSAKYKIGQNLTITSLSPQNPDAQLSFSGAMKMQTDLQYKTGSKAKLSTLFDYTLTSLIIDPTDDGDIKSGSATFHTTGDVPQGKWDYKGTITFLGNHKVRITIDGKTYTVDIQTGLIV